MSKVTVDTNVVVRYLLADDARQAEAARKLMQGAELVAISLPVLCETVWVLSRGYKLAAEDIAQAIATLTRARNVKTDQAAVDAGLVVLRAGGDFADGVIAHEGMALGGEVLVTFDKQAASLLKKQGGLRTRLL
jgi:predicted nucleic-acid-binding protein